MPDNNNLYSVKLPDGRTTQWSQDQYDKAKDRLFEKYPEANVVKTSTYDPQNVEDDSDFAIKLPDGRVTQWTPEQFGKAGNKLLEKYPNAEITRFKPVNYWGDKLTDIYGKMQSLKNELGELPADDGLGDLRNMDDDQLIRAATETQKPSSVRRREINRELESLRAEREKNPAWQSYWKQQNEEIDKGIADIDARLEKMRKKNPDAFNARVMSETFVGGTGPTLAGGLAANKRDLRFDQDYESLEAAKNMLLEAKRTASMPSKYGDEAGLSNFWEGVKGNAVDALSPVALHKALLNTRLIDAIQLIQSAEGKNADIVTLVNEHPEYMGYLSDEQKELVKSFVKKAEIEAGRADNMSRAYQMGAGAIQSAGFMLDFALAGGVGDAAAKGAVKAVGLEGAKKAAPKFAADVIGATAKALAMTPLMPSSYANFVNNLLTLDDAGSVDLSGKAIIKSIGDVLIENFSENAGEIALPFELKAADKIFGKTKFGDWAKAMRQTPMAQVMKRAGWNGIIGEMGEEWVGNALRVMTGVDKDALKDFATVEQQLITIGSFAPMTLFTGAVSTVQFRSASKAMKKAGVPLSKILAASGLNEEQIADILNVTGAETPEDLAHKMTLAVQSVSANGGDTAEAFKAAAKYTKAVSDYKVLSGVFEEQKDVDRTKRIMEINQTIGGENWYVMGEDEEMRVRTLTDASGKVSYVTAETDDQLAVVDEDGKHRFVSKSEIDSGQYTDSGSMSLNSYIDSDIANRKQAKEEQRIATEEAAQIQQIQQRLPVGAQLNVGTSEAPLMGTVTAVDANGLRVDYNDNGTDTYKVLSWKDAGDYLETPINVKTEEQIQEEQAEDIESTKERRQLYNDKLKPGTVIEVPTMLNGENLTPVQYEFQRAVIEDGQINLIVKDPVTGKETVVTEEEAMSGSLPSLLNSSETEEEKEEIAGDEAQEPAEIEDDGILKDFRGNPIPIKEDGGVNQTAFWNNDPEAWAKWNDERRGDGGANSRAYIAKAVKKLQNDAKEVQKRIDKELDFDKIDLLEQKLGQINDRIAELNSIEQNYVAAEIAKKEAEEAAAKREERSERARERELNEPQTLHEVVSNWIAGLKRGSLNREDFKRETGLGETELKKFFPYWAKKGRGQTVVELAESIAADDNSGLIPIDGTTGQPDIQAVRNAIIDVMTSASKPSDIKNATKEANLQREAEMQQAYEEQPSETESTIESTEDMPLGVYADYQVNEGVEVDDNGIPFVLSSDGTTTFGEITSEMGLTAAPIKLSQGVIVDPSTSSGYGLAHIEARHGDQIRAAGFSSVQEFVETVAKNYETIREGSVRNGNQTYLLQLSDTHNNTLVVELSKDGSYWNVNTAGIFKKSYGKNNKEVFSRHTTADQQSTTAGGSLSTDNEGGSAETSMISSETSDNKDSEKSEETSDSGENIQQGTIDFESEEKKEEPKTVQRNVTPYHPDNLRKAYESGDKDKIKSAEKAMSDYINGSNSIVLLKGTERQAKTRRNSAKNDSTEYKTQDFVAKAAAKRLKELDKILPKVNGMSAVKANDDAYKTYRNRWGASVEDLQRAIAYYEQERASAQAELDATGVDPAEQTDDMYINGLKGRISMCNVFLNGLNDQLTVELGHLTEAQEKAVAFVEGKTPEQVAAEHEAARQKPLKDRIKEWEDRTGVSIEAIESRERVTDKQAINAINAGERPTGWFNPNNGKVVIYLPNVNNESEIDRTYMHEIVSHKGLRDLLGEEGFNNLMDSVWDNMMTEADKAKWLKYNSHLKGSEEYLRREAADEFVAHLAEKLNTEENASAWEKIIEKVKEIMLKLGLNLKITDEDLSSLLQASLANYEKLQAERKAEAEKENQLSEEQEKPKKRTKRATKQENKIEDFGEKIGGARKDLARERIRDSVKLTAKDLNDLKDPDKILSRKQIAKYVAEGEMTSGDAATLLAANMAVRGMNGMESYKTAFLMKYRDLASAWEKGEDLSFEITDADIDVVFNQYSERIQQMPDIRNRIRVSLEYHVNQFIDYKRTYETLDYPNTARDLKSAYVMEGRTDKKFWVKGSPTATRGFRFDTFEQAIARIKTLYPEITNVDKEAKKAKESGDERTGHLKVVKDEYGWYRVKSTLIPGQIFLSKRFYNRKDAEAYLKENADALVEKELKMSTALMGSNIGMVQRQGQDYRGGKDVSEKQFMETFNPRGVEFGNWVPQAERQEYLNKTYDAIMDFCSVVGISPKAFFLGGRLGIGFGSRGHSGALAHYETLKEVINLTRMKGAGSLAHEWFHALDNQLAKQKTGNVSDMATDTKNVVRDEVANAFRDFVTAMNALDYTKRSHRAGAYWGEVWERAARLFADYTYNELGGKGVISPLLARNPEGQQIESEEDFIASDWPYATKEENEAIKPYFDRLFAAIQEEDGTGVLFRKEDEDLKQAQLDIINASNPMTDDIHTGIRSVNDIKTWDEAVSEARVNAEQGGWEELAAYPDITNEIVENALETGSITIYSSKPIADGTFVTPSKMQAKDYSGGEEIYSKEVPVSNVAWINTDEGQYAEIDGERENEIDNAIFRKAYHGTDANFDQFNLSYIGSGEGHQAHGYGHYVALNEDTGYKYAYLLGGRDDENERAAEAIDAQIANYRNWMQDAKNDMERRYYENAIAAEERHKEKLRESRHLYTVDIPNDNGENYIDERIVPTDAQRKKIAEGLQSIPNSEWRFDEDNATLFGDDTVKSLAEKINNGELNGYEMYASIAHGLGSKEASRFLSDLGFVGIKYNGGVDGPCAVIFSDDNIRITDHLIFRKSDIERDDMLHADGYDLSPFQNRLDDINTRIAEEGENEELLEEKTSLFDEYLSEVKTSDIDTHVCTLSELKDWLIGRGLNESDAEIIVNSYNNPFFVGEYNSEADAAIFLTERVPSIDYLRKEFVHERQHMRTIKSGDSSLLTRVAKAFGYNNSAEEARSRLYNAVQDLSGDAESYAAMADNDIIKEIAILANEFISYGMQYRYSDKEFDNTLKKYYISEEAINIINELYDEGRRSYVSYNGPEYGEAHNGVSEPASSRDLETPESGKSGAVQERPDAENNDGGYISGRSEGEGRTAKELIDSFDRDGFRAVVGEESIPEFYNSIYRALPEEMRKEFVRLAEQEGWNFNKAIEKRLSEIAFNGYENDETGILRMVGDLLRYYSGENLSEEAVRYILWKNGQPDDSLTRVSSVALRRRWDADRDEGLLFSKNNLEEELNAADQVAESSVDAAKESFDERKKGLRGDLLTLSRAMNAQKEYDKNTVEALTNLAKTLLREQFIDSLSRREVARLLGIVRTSMGKSPKTVKKNADALVDIVIDKLLKREKDGLDVLTKKTGTKVNATNLTVGGELDIKGQKTLKYYKESVSKKVYSKDDDGDPVIDTSQIDAELRDAYVDLDSKDDTVKQDAEIKVTALTLAKEYLQTVQNLNDNEISLREEKKKADKDYNNGNLSKTAHDQLIDSLERSIRGTHIQQIEAIREHREKLQEIISGSKELLIEARDREKARVDEIHHLANSDMKGVPTDEPGKNDSILNRLGLQTILGPLGTFNQFFRLFGRRNVYGMGNLYNKFVPEQRRAYDAEYLGIKESIEGLDKKVAEIFGEGTTFFDLSRIADSIDKKNRRAGKQITIKYRSGGSVEEKEHELGQSQLMFIYAANKMTDGQMKLRRMGLTEEKVDAIKGMIDDRLIRFMDWVQEEYLVNRRNKYNAVYERLWGASMDAINNYFPLRIDKRDLGKQEDIEADPYAPLPSTTTGAIIKRTKNTRALDLENADAISVLYDHIKEMEHWAAFAEYIKDVNTLISYKRFHNQVTSMRTVYGTGEELWKNFRDVLLISIGKYKPKSSKADKFITNYSRAFSVAKVSFRINTAIKQFASIVAFLPEVNIKHFAEALSHPMENWEWAMNELPSFEARREMQNMGNEKLMPIDDELKDWSDNVVSWLQKNGMGPNRFVDLLTCSIGARAVYMTKRDEYIRLGYSEENADKKAKDDAVTVFNETQQSSEGGFRSAMQSNKDFWSSTLSMFRNASFGYTRKAFNSIRALSRMSKKGYKEDSIEFMRKQLLRDGLSEEQALEGAERQYNKAKFYHAATIVTNFWINTIFWNMFGHLWYYLFGDDDDQKKAFLEEDIKRGFFGGPFEGLAGGSVISEVIGNVVNKESAWKYSPSLNPLLSDLEGLFRTMKSDSVKGTNEIVNLAAQVITGVNPQTFTDILVAIHDACNGDLDTTKEALFLMMRVIQVPQSQIEQIYIDELGTDAAGAKKMSYSEMAKRYAEYKVNREAPLTGWAYSDEGRKKKIKSKEKTFKNKVKERKELKKQ